MTDRQPFTSRAKDDDESTTDGLASCPTSFTASQPPPEDTQRMREQLTCWRLRNDQAPAKETAKGAA